MELVINFSGGKDSCAMLVYLCEQYPDVKKHVVFADTGWEHPGTEDWCRQIVSRFGFELHVVRNSNKTFMQMVERRGKFPGMKNRQCTSDLKRGPGYTWMRNNIKDCVIVSCLGIRSDESTGRMKQPTLKRYKPECNGKRTIWVWNPIKDWPEDQVYEYLEINGVPIHSVYSYLKRFSCRICIYMSQHDICQVKKHDPEAIEIISRLEEKIGFTMFQKGPIKKLLHA